MFHVELNHRPRESLEVPRALTQVKVWRERVGGFLARRPEATRSFSISYQACPALNMLRAPTTSAFSWSPHGTLALSLIRIETQFSLPIHASTVGKGCSCSVTVPQ
jgi:hypothetical protein